MVSNNSVKNLWKKHWREQSTIEESGSFYGKLLHQKRLAILKEMLKEFDPKSTVLDMGCGGGTTITAFKEAGFDDIIGIDFAEESILRCERIGLVCDKDVFLMDAKRTLFPSESFDIVFSEGLWEHFTDPRLHMVEACRLAKKYIIVIQPDHFSFFGCLMHIGWELFNKEKGGVREYSFPLSYFKNFLELYGFKLITSKSTILHEQTVMVFERQTMPHYIYNINGINIRMHIDKPYDKLDPYCTSVIEEPELIFHVGRISLKKEKSSIHAHYSHKLSRWEILLKDFNKKQTTVYFKGEPLFSRNLFFTMIFEPLLQYKQSQNNKLVLHASAVSKNGKSHAFFGDACIGKTSILMHFLSKGYCYLADDQVTIDTETLKILPYALPIGVNLSLAIRTHLSLSLRARLSLIAQTLINTLFLNYSHLTTNIQLNELNFGNQKTSVGVPTKLSKIFILKSGRLSIKQLTFREAFTELWENKIGSRSKLPALVYYSSEFKKKHPEFSLWSTYYSLLTELVKKISVYKVTFTKDCFPSAIKLIEKEIESDM